MTFKFAGNTPPGNSVENHPATVIDGYIDWPSRMLQTVAWIICAMYVFHLFSKLGYTRWNQLRTVAIATDHRQGLVASLMSVPDPTRVGTFKKSQPIKTPTPLFERFLTLFIPFPSLSNFQLPTSLLYQHPQIPQLRRSSFYWSSRLLWFCYC